MALKDTLSGLPSWAKGLIVAGIVGGGGVLAYTAYQAWKKKQDQTSVLANKAGNTINDVYNVDTTGAVLLPQSQVDSYVTALGGEYHTWITKLTPIVANMDVLDGIVRQLRTKAQFRQVADAYAKKYGEALMDNVQNSSTWHFGTDKMNPQDQQAFNSILDYINNLPNK